VSGARENDLRAMVRLGKDTKSKRRPRRTYHDEKRRRGADGGGARFEMADDVELGLRHVASLSEGGWVC